MTSRYAGVVGLRPFLIFVLIAGMAASAYANSSMGLALEMFDYAYWGPYVLAMIVLEAWIIGRKLGDRWYKAFGISLVANAFTAGCCCPMCCSSFHGSLVGSGENPNPFLNGVALFTIFGVVSATLEAVFWAIRREGVTAWFIWRQSFLAHVIGVPVALLILLIPNRPYKGLEATTNGSRSRELQVALKRYGMDASDKGLARISGVPELIQRFEAGKGTSPDPDAWTAAYRANMHRFDFGEAKREPYEWNSRLAGLRLINSSSGNQEDAPVWLLRYKDGSGFGGYALSLASGSVSAFSEQVRG